MTPVRVIATLINSAIKDAAEATAKNGAITIYEDPNCGGWAWKVDLGDYMASGPIGHDAEFYGGLISDEDDDEFSDWRNSDEYNDAMFAVGAALEAAGYEVAR